MKNYTSLILSLICIINFHLPLAGQNNSVQSSTDFLIKNKGIPFIKNFSPKDYQASIQNWAVTQDNRGVMYFGNNDGVLEFDGLNWRLIKTSNKSVVRSLAKDENGRIYVGSLGEIGYLTPDSLGRMKYKSLLPLIPQEDRNFNNMWDIFITPKAIYMISFSGLYIFPKDIPSSQEKVKVIHPSPNQLFHRGYLIGDQIYIREWEKGLLKLNGDKLELVLGGEQFAQERIYSMLPYGKGKVLVASRTKGLFLYDGQAFTPWRTDLTPFLNEAKIYNGQLIQDKYYLLTTLNAGIVILDKAGNPIQSIDQAKGLVSNSIYYPFLDRNQNLWLGCENGISMLQIGLPITIFDTRLGVEGGANDIHLFDGYMYAATNQGLYNKSWKVRENVLDIKEAGFKLMENSSGQTWNFLETDQKLFSGHFNGILNIKGTIARKIYQGQSHIMDFLLLNNNKVLIAGIDGLELFSKKAGRWTLIKQLKNYPSTFDQYHYLLPDKDGAFWTSHESVGVYSFKIDEVTDSLTNLKLHEAKKYGLPTNLQIRIFKVDNRVLLATEKGIFTFDKEKNKFKRDILDQYMPTGKRIFYLAEDRNGNVWFKAGEKIGVLQKSGEKFIANYNHFAPLKGSDVYCITPLKSGEVMIGTSQGIIHYSGSLNRTYAGNFSTFLQKVELETSQGRDSVIFAGLYRDSKGMVLTKQPKTAIKKFPFSLNSFRFTFSTPYYTQPEAIQYSYYLKGFDQKWSEWVNHKEKEYTNLSEGTYTFCLKARNVYGNETQEVIYSFTIEPPWYRTLWAYIGFSLMALLIFWGVIWLNTRRLRQQKEFLEQKVEERTAEIRNQNKILEEQKEEIVSKNDALEIQKEEITTKNIELETQKEEMIAQAEVLKAVNRELTQQKNEIERQRDEIGLQRDNIQVQKNEIERQRDEIGLQRDNIQVQKNEIERQRDILEKTNDIIRRKNHDITSSIRSAQTIQQAILPFDQRMKQVLREYFVIYRPKDIVSGDFYWLASIDDKVLIATVDCTGHGVPGAFMSMIGYTLLNEIVNDKKVTQPASILEELHQFTRVALRQESQANSDGMDLCLCMMEPIDSLQVQITFAGAKRPLYYIPEGSTKVLEIKGSRLSIGGGKHFEDLKFTQQAFAVDKGTIIYLTTDGMIDQNNQERKKFGSARFKALLEQCASIPLPEQEEKLNKALDQHQAGTDQRDDITVWAIRV